MNTKNFKLNAKVIALGLASLLIYSCGDPKPADGETGEELPDTDTVKAVVLNVGGELFSIPSPIQTALLIQKSGVTYDKAILNAVFRSS
ncbi:MAG: hypothetical protein IPH32_13370 [Bacteroidetes bacterium]|nr:hypothetical protein [Bacteroidota bacterium]